MSTRYRLPRGVEDRLSTALQGRKNASAAIALATWIARFWSAPTKLGLRFPIDRRAIAGREDLGLSEARESEPPPHIVAAWQASPPWVLVGMAARAGRPDAEAPSQKGGRTA